ncbi:MAG TPA: hypothetical protein VL326_19860 [Kofleriaceae bacterium]|nr:hypothetical protein [Kofleriaceae bacterium]
MRIQMLLGSSLIAAAALVGCGGDDGHVRVPDAKVFNDSKIFMDARSCLTPASLGNGTVGSTTAPAMGQFFLKNMMDGSIFFGIKISLDSNAMPDVVYFIVPEPSGGFLTGVPYAFETDPNATGTPQALSFLDGDAASNGDTTQELWPQTSTPAAAITFSMIGKTATSKITATINMTKYAEIDDNSAVVPGGCESTLTGLTLNLQQNAAAPTRLAPVDPTATSQTDTSGASTSTSTDHVRNRDFRNLVPVAHIE